ncbi:hypothetical protein PDIP_33170 [Penicillium digitatum Pd1]|uniref:Uncharacterized protein n=1 Tax=Penicillium digitatum (strain Pd1 / CECT 20795) TaxID=1170230 RepID=K9GR12_PEND1|nr:hypothetical protein PDIP_33170 [Penicillium digitatum Pd1]EKV17118.1 hypothetical protein PDIP_33170 [Penicillium digitatum Pd1]
MNDATEPRITNFRQGELREDNIQKSVSLLPKKKT